MIKFREKQEPEIIEDSKLIESVQKHEFLFNNKHPDYRNLTLRAQVWAQIANELNITDQSVVQKRWKVIREKFSVSYRKFHENHINSTWNLYNKCEFLVAYVNLKPDIKKEEPEEPEPVEFQVNKSPFDESLLTKLVKDRPVLYDKQHEDFRAANMRRKAWIEVSKMTGWDVSTLQKRWRVMRDRFVRELRRTKNIDSDSQITCSAFFRDMLFLVRHVKSKKYEAEADEALMSDDNNYLIESENVSQSLETCIIPEAEVEAIENAEEVTYSMETLDENYVEYESRDETEQENYEDNLDDFDDEEQALEDEQHNQSEVVAVEEIPKETWFKKRQISFEINNEEPPMKFLKEESPTPNKNISESPSARVSESTDEDIAFGQTIGSMLKRIPQHLKTSVKLRIFQSLADFEIQHKLSG